MIALAASPLAAQGKSKKAKAQGIPPGHMPPAGACRVWYDGTPPGRQPAATNCDEAERIASRDRNARVIYGADRNARDNGRIQNGRVQNGRVQNERGRAIPRDSSQYPSSYPGRAPSGRAGSGYGTVAFDNGYRDGYEKGLEDIRDRDSYDPVRHSRYRSADRGYSNNTGSKDDYKLVYRDGFEAGYDDGYRGRSAANGADRTRTAGRLPWPF